MNVLIVDDAVFMRRMLGDILTKSGHTIVAEASNGREAFDKYKMYNPDIVTMDITMQDVDGLQGLKMIMSYDKNAVVIMCSAMGQQALVIEAIQSGAKDFIVKPFTPDRVNESVSKYCR